MAFDPYTSSKDARKLGLLGPTVMASARAVHARELGKQMLTGGVTGLKKGAKIRKTRFYKLHKGERVLTAKQAKRYKKR